MLASSMVDCGFKPQSGQTKDYKFGICCFSAKHTALSNKITDRLAQYPEVYIHNEQMWLKLIQTSLGAFSYSESCLNQTSQGPIVAFGGWDRCLVYTGILCCIIC
jgi:hypothetical protein